MSSIDDELTFLRSVEQDVRAIWDIPKTSHMSISNMLAGLREKLNTRIINLLEQRTAKPHEQYCLCNECINRKYPRKRANHADTR